MKSRASDPPNGPAPTPRPRTPALVRRGVAALALGVVGCGGGAADAPPQVIPPQAPPTPDVTAPQIVPPQAPPPQTPPPPQMVPPQAPPPNAR